MTLEKKSAVDHTFWGKKLEDGTELELTEEVGYRWGEAWVELDPRENGWKEGEPLKLTEFGLIDYSLSDGCWTDYNFCENSSDDERELLDEAYHPEDAGWESYEGEITFYGPVEITED